MVSIINKVRRALPGLFALIVVWCVWNESVALKTLVEGLIVSSITLMVTHRFFLRALYTTRYHLSLFVLIRYFFILLIEIFKSGWHAIYITVTNRIDVGVVDLPTCIQDPLIGVLVANAITLTPGTVTIEFVPGRFKVIWIDCFTTDPEQAAEAIKGGFERALLADQIDNKLES